ncbi:MAG: thiamine-phosphate kinase [Proteobacteria bacterium]|jgi:thiamine-monophosphate kinase|nr:thiamine-phosphate kinase [Pseudomonadota bacterium]MDA0958068.1 thiamine-phosphate kinase [Pseudomonadota bacterium]
MTLSEFDIIERYFAPLGNFRGPAVRLGPGDDCAVIMPPSNEQLCVSSDTFIEGTHFPVDAPAAMTARRTLAAALSDLAAMGSKPLAVTGALTLASVSPEWLEEFANALGNCISVWQSPLVGGNISRGEALSITWTVMGSLPQEQFISRSGATEPSDIFVSGWPGRAGLALQRRLAGQQCSKKIAQHYEAPEPRLELGQHLRGLASAMIDVSDGLLADLNHILVASDVGAEIDLSSFNFDQALVAEAGDEVLARRLTLTAGDDYELCFVAPPEHRTTIADLSKQLDLPLTKIGQTKATKGLTFCHPPEGMLMEPLLLQSGYQHF